VQRTPGSPTILAWPIVDPGRPRAGGTALAEIKAMRGATLPHLATRAELADSRGALRADPGEQPGKTSM